MKSRFKEGCFYCEHNQTLHERMIPIVTFDASTVYLNRDQTHPGRVIVALNWHVDEIFELSQQQRTAFIEEVSLTAKVVKEHFNAAKINLGVYGDTVSHLHFHIVPKVPADIDWDDSFINNPKDPAHLSDSESPKRVNQLREELEDEYETIRD
ncbi:HIT family protein [Lentilactobacillus kisonensis]|uniref:Histidine triad domain protein n=2 Tax=Lentilactobacillus kisonensis TaxID=481722 RepID=H1LHN9_9LACO|nr:HIT family protein [Lentilactobacillus kisonensis]EHO50221.1 histidine triad domain protein [Lentilactobacillus kisonensis F0435]